MPFIEFFRSNVRHVDVLVILFSFFHSTTLFFRFTYLLSETTRNFDYISLTTIVATLV